MLSCIDKVCDVAIYREIIVSHSYLIVLMEFWEVFKEFQRNWCTSLPTPCNRDQ